MMMILTNSPCPKDSKSCIPSPTSQNHQLNNSLKQFTDQLFGTTSSKFLLTPPREPTPPRDSSKGNAITIIEEPGNEL
ncbi:hypothetical protein Tco_0463629, partial [Tanacetum coccineum]